MVTCEWVTFPAPGSRQKGRPCSRTARWRVVYHIGVPGSQTRTNVYCTQHAKAQTGVEVMLKWSGG